MAIPMPTEAAQKRSPSAQTADGTGGIPAQEDTMRHALSAVLAVTILSVAGLAAGEAVPPRIGGPGSVLDPAKVDARFPDAKEWAVAGVAGGIPWRNSMPVVATLKPGDDIAAAMRTAGKGVILLKAGTHTLDATLSFASGVVLRGEDRERTVIAYGVTRKDMLTAMVMRKVKGCGLEDLTIQHQHIAALDPATYLGKYENFESLGFPRNDAAAIEPIGASDCWIDNCRILCSVSRPLRIHGNSARFTVRDTLIDKCLHKGGSGAGYCEVIGASHVLFYRCTVTNIRHICLDGEHPYAVLFQVTHGVDINWHCIPPMAKSLVEGCTWIPQAQRHPWGQFSHYKDAAAEDNLVYRSAPNFADGAVYHVTWPGSSKEVKGRPMISRLALDPPASGTLFPVTGIDCNRGDYVAMLAAKGITGRY